MALTFRASLPLMVELLKPSEEFLKECREFKGMEYYKRNYCLVVPPAPPEDLMFPKITTKTRQCGKSNMTK